MTITRRAAPALIFWLCCHALPAVAQERAGEVLRQLEQGDTTPKKRPALPALDGLPQQESEKARRITHEDTTRFFVKRIEVHGGGLLTEDEVNTATRPVDGTQQTLAELLAVADKLTTLLRTKGYLTSYAYIPSQELKDGIITIRVIAGTLGNVSVSGNQSYSGAFIRGHLEKLKDTGALNEAELMRQLLILNENDSLDARAALRAGKEPGSTDIQVSVKDKRPFHAGLGYDNFGSNSISRSRLSGHVGVGNLAFDGDMLTLSGMTGLNAIDIDRLSYGRAEYRTAINHSGTQLGAYYANSLYQAGGNIASLGLNGRANVAGLYLSHPLIRTSSNSLTLKLGFEYKDVSDYMLGVLNSRDRIRTLQTELNHDFSDPFGGRNVLTAGWVTGLRGFLNGAEGRDSKSSRLNATGDFNRLTLDVARYQSLGGQHRLVLKAGGQYSPDELFVAEQYSLGGAYSVRGYRPSFRNGDSGYTLGAELHLALTNAVQKSDDLIPPINTTSLFLVPFVDHGGVYRNNPQPGEASSSDLTSLGTGLRLYWGNVSARLDCAVPQTGGWMIRNTQTWLQVAVSF